MKTVLSAKLLLLFLVLFIFSPLLHGSETDTSKTYIATGIGIEQLTYREELADIKLTSSDTDLTNWVLYLEGRQSFQNFFIGAKGYIPLSTDEAREFWTSEGQFEQSNSLTYRWFRAQMHTGYTLNSFLTPYLGIGWSYAKQERGNFENVNPVEILHETATEKLYSFSALLGLQGGIPFASRWSLSYCVEYMLPFYSTITNDGLPGWKASDISGFYYALTGRLHYAFSETFSATLHITGGRQHWEGSDWIRFSDSRAKWPENNTDFIGGFLGIYKNF